MMLPCNKSGTKMPFRLSGKLFPIVSYTPNQYCLFNGGNVKIQLKK